MNKVHSVFLLKIGNTFNEAQNNCLLQMVEYKVPNVGISQQKPLCVFSWVHVQGLSCVQLMDLLGMNSRLDVLAEGEKCNLGVSDLLWLCSRVLLSTDMKFCVDVEYLLSVKLSVFTLLKQFWETKLLANMVSWSALKGNNISQCKLI